MVSEITVSYALEPMNTTLYGKRDFVYVIQDLKMGTLSWIIWVSSKCNHKCPYRGGKVSFGREPEGDGTMKVRGFKDGGREGTINQGMQLSGKKQVSLFPQVSGGANQKLPTP